MLERLSEKDKLLAEKDKALREALNKISDMEKMKNSIEATSQYLSDELQKETSLRN